MDSAPNNLFKYTRIFGNDVADYNKTFYNCHAGDLHKVQSSENTHGASET